MTDTTRLLFELLLVIYAGCATYALFVLHHMVSQAEAATKDAQDLRDRAKAEALVAREKSDACAKDSKAAWDAYHAQAKSLSQKSIQITDLLNRNMDELRARDEKITGLTDAIAKLSQTPKAPAPDPDRWSVEPKCEPKPKRKRA